MSCLIFLIVNLMCQFSPHEDGGQIAALMCPVLMLIYTQHTYINLNIYNYRVLMNKL